MFGHFGCDNDGLASGSGDLASQGLQGFGVIDTKWAPVAAIV